MLFVPSGPDYQWYYSNTLNTQPAGAFGTTITPGTTANTYGAWAQVASAANMAQDTYGVLINFNNGATSSGARNILAEMGVDNAGGTSYISRIPYLIASQAFPFTTAPGGQWYFFPLYIKAGSSIAFRAMSNLTTAFSVNVTFYGQPRRPDAIRAGAYVEAIGIDTTNRTGTAITPGTTSEGAWTSLGTNTNSCWWWQTGISVNSSTVLAATYNADLSAGNATFKKLLIENQPYYGSTAEQMGNMPITVNAYNNVASSQTIYGRIQGTSSQVSMTMAAYGLGG